MPETLIRELSSLRDRVRKSVEKLPQQRRVTSPFRESSCRTLETFSFLTKWSLGLMVDVVHVRNGVLGTKKSLLLLSGFLVFPALSQIT